MDKYAALKQEIIRHGGKIGKNASAFRLLYALAKINGISSMHHSRRYIAKSNKIKVSQVDKLAIKAINCYIVDGKFTVPSEFLFLQK